MKVRTLIEKLMEYEEDLEVVIYDEDNDYTMDITNVITDKSNEVDYERVALVKRLLNDNLIGFKEELL